ncbi:hypothetical protein [Enteractinococcus coprophilus]|uniref:hypothetical protein n=1 Tax=Enteractinococcus coprophilus TaxID=1027633 RepID=UPI003656892F
MVRPGINDGMVKPMNTSAIATATGRSWESWVQHFDDAGARQMDHPAIAALALELMPESVEQKEWWAQSTAVAFGQYAGLRVPGQTSTGDFQLSTTRTVPGNKDQALQAWLEVVNARTEFGGVPIEGEASTSSTDRWRYWRVALSDGSRVVVNISEKQNGKSAVGLQHSKLDSAEAIQFWRPIWKDLLAKI